MTNETKLTELPKPTEYRKVSMNKSPKHSNDAKLVNNQRGFNQQEWNRQQYKAGLMVMITMIGCGILLTSPSYLSARYACMVMSISPAIYMTAYLYLYPNSLRSSSGSLFAAVGLVAFLWLSGVGFTVASLLDIIS